MGVIIFKLYISGINRDRIDWIDQRIRSSDYFTSRDCVTNQQIIKIK